MNPLQPAPQPALQREPTLQEQARTLLTAVARPGEAIGDTDAVVDYIMHLLAHTDLLTGLMTDFARDGMLDRSLRELLGAFFGLYAATYAGQNEEFKEIEAALEDVALWYAKLRAQSERRLEPEAFAQALCPISYTRCAELDCPVAIDVGAVPCVFEAEAILKWVHVSMQTPGRKGLATHPLDRSALRLGQIQAVCWTSMPTPSP